MLTSKLSEMGMLRLMPRTLALMAVQRQAATSRSTSPSSKVQHGLTGGVPTTAPTAPPSSLAQTPSLRASLGQLPKEGVAGVLGVGFGLGGEQDLLALTRTKKRRLMEMKRAADEDLLESISLTSLYQASTNAIVLLLLSMSIFLCERKSKVGIYRMK